MNDFGRRGCPHRFLNRPPLLYVYFPWSHFDCRIGSPLARSLARSLVCCAARSCALVSISRMGLIGILCVRSAEKHAQSSRVVQVGCGSCQTTWWGFCWRDRIILLQFMVGVDEGGASLGTLSSRLFLLLSSRHLLFFSIYLHV